MIKKSALIDVPVQINIWIRPSLQKKQFEIINKVKPSILFIISDGGRNDEEWRLINDNRRMIEDGIDWECKIYKLYEDHNIGVKKMIIDTHEFIWKRVDRCIFLEDDIIPSISFFRYCKELLDYYENDFRISAICGMNHLGESYCVSGDYFFSKQGSIWGYALWKRSYNLYYKYGYENDKYLWRLLEKATRNDMSIWKAINRMKADKDMYFSPTEFFMDLSIYAQNQLLIIPKKNMISCHGATRESHGSDSINRIPKGNRRVYFMKTYEIDFPLKHPEFIIPDTEYEKKRNRIVGRNHPIITKYRKIERLLLVLKDKDFRYLWRKIRKVNYF